MSRSQAAPRAMQCVRDTSLLSMSEVREDVEALAGGDGGLERRRGEAS